MTEDQKRLLKWVLGEVERDARGLTRVRYLEDGSEEELEARRAFARELRSGKPLPAALRFVLAGQIDPDSAVEERYIRIERRHRGRPEMEPTAQREIAEHIWKSGKNGKPVKQAIADAEAMFGLKRTQITKIWGHWKTILKEQEGAPTPIQASPRFKQGGRG